MPATAAPTFRSPPGTLFWGHRAAMVADQIGFLERCRREYGDIVPLRVGPVRMWLIADPEMIGEILTTRAAHFRKDMGARRMKVLLGEGLLTSEGEEHDRNHRLAQPAFRQKEVERYAEAMVETTARVIAGWRDGESVDLAAELSRLALGIVGRALFGADVLEDGRETGPALTEILELLEHRFWALVPLPLWIPTCDNVRFSRAMDVLDRTVYKMIAERRARGGAGEDLLGRLLAAREGTAGFTDKQLRDEVMTLFLAGHETTANALSFAFRLLAENPDAARRLREEADAALGDRPATAADVPHLPYAAGVFQEAMRLYPPAWILGREAIGDVELGGGRVRIPHGHMVIFSPYLMHRDPRYWEEPLAFRPERFLHDAPRPVPWTYFPFGGGKRACIGRSFAMLEGVLVLATIARAVDFEIDVSRPLRLLPQTTLRPADGIPARVRLRVRA